MGAVLIEVDRRHAQRDSRADIGAVAAHAGAAPDAQRRQRRLQPIGDRPGAIGQIDLEPPDAIGAEVAFLRGRMALAAVDAGVLAAAEAARLLRAKPDHANGPARTRAVEQPLRRRRGNRHPGAIVDRALAQIPAVEMPADQDDAGGRVAAGHLGDDVARFTLAREPLASASGAA